MNKLFILTLLFLTFCSFSFGQINRAVELTSKLDELEKRKNELSKNLDELRVNYTDQNPKIIKTLEELKVINQSIDETSSELKQLKLTASLKTKEEVTILLNIYSLRNNLKLCETSRIPACVESAQKLAGEYQKAGRSPSIMKILFADALQSGNLADYQTIIIIQNERVIELLEKRK